MSYSLSRQHCSETPKAPKLEPRPRLIVLWVFAVAAPPKVADVCMLELRDDDLEASVDLDVCAVADETRNAIPSLPIILLL